MELCCGYQISIKIGSVRYVPQCQIPIQALFSHLNCQVDITVSIDFCSRISSYCYRHAWFKVTEVSNIVIKVGVCYSVIPLGVNQRQI
jgi:hypothetical protein